MQLSVCFIATGNLQIIHIIRVLNGIKIIQIDFHKFAPVDIGIFYSDGFHLVQGGQFLQLLDHLLQFFRHILFLNAAVQRLAKGLANLPGGLCFQQVRLIMNLIFVQ